MKIKYFGLIIKKIRLEVVYVIRTGGPREVN
jgi:hypothetical protein